MTETYRFVCETCDYKTNHKSNYGKHCLSLSHKVLLNPQNDSKTLKMSKNFFCKNCEKGFIDKSGLWRHNKKCNNQNTIQQLKDELAEIKALLLTQNQIIVANTNNNQLANQTQTSNSNPTITNVHGDHNNIQNNVFNTQVFLENECKNAVNIDDIIKKVIIDADKLDVFKEKGTSLGIANILNDILKQYTIYERPIHCSDLKRLSMHVKDNDIWLSKEEGIQKLNQTIYYIQQFAMKNVGNWENYYKNKLDKDNLDKQFISLIKNTTNYLTDNDNKKIIKTIASNIKLGENVVSPLPPSY